MNELHKRQPEPRGRVEYLYPTGDTIKPEGLEKLTQERKKERESFMRPLESSVKCFEFKYMFIFQP